MQVTWQKCMRNGQFCEGEDQTMIQRNSDNVSRKRRQRKKIAEEMRQKLHFAVVQRELQKQQKEQVC